MAYSLDTSYLVRAWTIWYPREVFPGVWQVLVSAAQSGEIILVRPVGLEVANQVPEILALFEQYAPNWSIDVSKDKRLKAALTELEKNLVAGHLIRRYNGQNVQKYIQVADPSLVLHAQLYGHVVVSNELSDRKDKKGPKIPDLCDELDVAHASPKEFAEALGFEFWAKLR